MIGSPRAPAGTFCRVLYGTNLLSAYALAGAGLKRTLTPSSLGFMNVIRFRRRRIGRLPKRVDSQSVDAVQKSGDLIVLVGADCLQQNKSFPAPPPSMSTAVALTHAPSAEKCPACAGKHRPHTCGERGYRGGDGTGGHRPRVEEEMHMSAVRGFEGLPIPWRAQRRREVMGPMKRQEVFRGGVGQCGGSVGREGALQGRVE